MYQRSKIQKRYDFHQIVWPEKWRRWSVDEKRIAAYIDGVKMQIRKAHGRLIEKTTPIENGDIVCLRMRSEDDKYCRENLSLNVGKGFFDPQLERSLIGLRTGEERVLSVPASVQVKILSVRTRDLPDLTDEMVREASFDVIDGASDIADMEKKLYEIQYEGLCMEGFEKGAGEYIRDEMLKRSEFRIDPKEWAEYLQERRAEIASQIEETGEDRKNFLMRVLRLDDNESDVETHLDREIEKEFLTELYALDYIGEDPRLSEDVYREELSAYARESGFSQEDCEAMMPYARFVAQNAVGFLQYDLLAFYRENQILE